MNFTLRGIAKNGKERDEYYTPAYAVRPLLPFLRPNSTIWCPFDTEESAFVKVLGGEGHRVIATHISTGDDFFNTYRECDYIISNPPYSQKSEVLERLYELKKPFAMLMGVVGIFDNLQRAEMFKENGVEVLYLNPRVSYIRDGRSVKGVPFQSAYFCYKVLPKQIMFAELEKG